MAVQQLTKQAIKALKTTKDSQTFWDSSFRGSSFGVRVYRSGAKKYVFQYRTPSGRQKYMEIGDALFKTLAEARDEALKLAARVKAGEDPALEKAEKKGAKTFGEIVAEFRAIYYRDLQLAPKTTANYDSRLDLYLLPKFGPRKIWDITQADVVALLDLIKVERGAAVQAARVLELLKTIFNFAKGRGDLEENPCDGLKKVKRKKRTRYLFDDEIGKYWNACESEKEPIRSLFKLILLTGQRSEEVRSAKWSDIRGESWHFPKTKSQVEQYLPITPLMASILEKLREENLKRIGTSRSPETSHFETFLFPSPRSVSKNGAPYIKSIAKAFDRIEKKVLGEEAFERIMKGLPTDTARFTPHDMRRTMVTKMRQLGVSKDTVRKILNHAEARLESDSLLGTYDRHDQAPEVREALVRFGTEVLRLAKVQG